MLRKTLLVLLLLALIPTAPIPAHASTPCDGVLFSAGVFTAIKSDLDPVILDNFQEYVAFDTFYTVRYRLYYSDQGNKGVLEIYRGGKLLGRATNSSWNICKPGAAWRNYLIRHGTQP